jgi:predicted RNA binding protein YcfA (HicA-like mRNA interferase family)
MSKIPVLKPREVVRQRGSHKQFRHVDGRATTVPFHSGRDISPTLFRVIARDIGMTAEALLGLTPTQGTVRLPENPEYEVIDELPESDPGHTGQ